MAPVLIATPAAVDANSYETSAEADAYFESRLPLVPPWDESDTKEIQLVMGTRLLDALFRGSRTLVPAQGALAAFYRIGRKWAGLPATATQRLAWPRTGLFHGNGTAVGANEIPWELKDALSELAGQLGMVDRTLDFQVATQGITSVKAGAVAVTFRDGYIASATLPQAVIDLIPPDWYTEEIVEGTQAFDIEVMP